MPPVWFVCAKYTVVAHRSHCCGSFGNILCNLVLLSVVLHISTCAGGNASPAVSCRVAWHTMPTCNPQSDLPVVLQKEPQSWRMLLVLHCSDEVAFLVFATGLFNTPSRPGWATPEAVTASRFAGDLVDARDFTEAEAARVIHTCVATGSYASCDTPWLCLLGTWLPSC